MASQKRMFNEVKLEIIKADIIYSFLDSIMVFFILYFIISLFDIKFAYGLLIPLVASVAYFFVNTSRRIKRSRLKDMEDANPQLREILRTAHDNQDENNPMVQSLFEDLRGKLRTASSGKLLDSKKITTRVVSAIATVFLIVILSSITINIQKIDIPFEKLNFLKDTGTRTEGEITDIFFNETDVVYGDSSIAKLGSDVVNIQVNPANSEADLSNVGEAEDRELVSGEAPDEIGVTTDAYSNQKVLEEAEAAVNYSQRIKKIS